MQAQMAESLNKVQQWVEAHDYKGYEPFDGLSSWVAPRLRWTSWLKESYSKCYGGAD